MKGKYLSLDRKYAKQLSASTSEMSSGPGTDSKGPVERQLVSRKAEVRGGETAGCGMSLDGNCRLYRHGVSH